VNAPLVSIVIPVLDDTDALAHLLLTIEPHDDVEIIVVNGGASNGRLTAATERRDVRLLSSAPGRGRQMNVGALTARGRWFVFVHADTRLPPQWLSEIRRVDADPAIVGGSFRFQLDSAAWQARLIERGVRWRVRWLDLAYGDQALFVRRDAFHAIGGYPEWPLMEDVALIRGLWKLGRLNHSALPVETSARRWEQDGWWRRSAKNVLLQILFFAGASPGWLARRYSSLSPLFTREALVVMVRAPSDTRGKSRLTRGFSGNHVELRRAILLDTLDAVRSVSGADLFTAFEPADAAQELQTLMGGAARMFPQQGDSLGDRMRNAFAALFEHGYSSVVMIGSDLPTLPACHVEQAFDRLRNRREALVIGPATDGSYYLIGLRRMRPELFEGIPWSTPDALTATTSVAGTLGLAVSLLPMWYDVDDVDDLRRVMADESRAGRTRAWVTAHAGIDRLLVND
jgi:rSAM/selenodomain-associated transferase 2/rSAM/selenodomain-associated transferase 1